MSKPVTAAACRRIIRRKPITASLLDGYRARGWEEHLPAVYERAAALFREHQDASPALRVHLTQLLPMIALYEAAQRITGSREAALAFFDEWAFLRLERMIKPVRLLMKTGLYRLVPALCSWMQPRLFGEDAGFASRAVPDAPVFAADMTRCPYAQTCLRHGCPELTRFSCRADDITYGSLHPRLVWARTQTLGTGGSCCDFRLYVKEKRHD